MTFDHNGIGKLADAQSCTVTEKRNGSYELKLVCPADGIHAERLEEGNIILAKSSDTGQSQPFRIYKVTTPIDGKLEVQARHISYQLNFITIFSDRMCRGDAGAEKSCCFGLPILRLDGCGIQRSFCAYSAGLIQKLPRRYGGFGSGYFRR